MRHSVKLAGRSRTACSVPLCAQRNSPAAKLHAARITEPAQSVNYHRLECCVGDVARGLNLPHPDPRMPARCAVKAVVGVINMHLAFWRHPVHGLAHFHMARLTVCRTILQLVWQCLTMATCSVTVAAAS